MFKKRKQHKAFTLVELLITIAVVGILFVVLVSRVDFATDKARITGAQNDINAMQYAVHQVALAKGEIVDDLDLLATMLNKNLDSELMVKVEGNMLKTYATDPWGNEYQLRYHKGVDNKGQIQIISAGPDSDYNTDDNIVVSVLCVAQNGKTDVIVKNDIPINELIREDGTIPNQPNIPGHNCLFDRTVQSSEFLHTAGNCAFEARYYYSCSCGAKGTLTFDGSKDLNTHIGNTNTICTSYNDEQHKTITKCSGCREELDVSYETHTFSNNTCSKCGHVQHTHFYDVENAIEANKATDATCSLPATYYYTCSCGAKGIDTFESGEKLAHNYINGVVTTPATCKETGVRTYTCACGDTKLEMIPVIPHTEVIDKAVEATCTSTGLTAGKHCSACNTVIEAQQTIAIKGHTLGTNATCTTAQTCIVCNAELQPALGHEYQSHTTQPTCTTAGYTTHTCTRCGDNYTDNNVNALGHTEVVDNGIAATCTTTGLTAGKHCSVCNAVIQSQQVVSALGHAIVQHAAKAANCTSVGWSAYETCNRCTYSTYKEIAATGHTNVYPEPAEAGKHTICSICGITTNTNHSYQKTTEIAATCTSKGSSKYECECGYNYVLQDIDALGHIDNDNNNKCDMCGVVLKIVEGLGEIKVESSNDIENIEDIEINYNPDNGNLSGIVPPVNNTPIYPEVSNEILPTMIEFNGGNIQKQTNYTPGTYETVTYTTTHTEEVKSVYATEWDAAIFTHITKQDGTTTTVAKPFDISILREMPSIYIVYDSEHNGKNITVNGVSNVANSVWSIYFDEDDSLENAIYLAHRLNLYLGKTTTTTHVAQWNGTCYETLDVDDEILVTKTVMKTYETTETKTIQITAPSTSTEYVYIPFSTLKAEEGMTWREWLASDYNTSGYQSPIIKTADFEDVSYDDVIVAGESYGFMFYSISGTWQFNDEILMDDFAIEGFIEYINFTSNGKTYSKIDIVQNIVMGGGLRAVYFSYDDDNVFVTHYTSTIAPSTVEDFVNANYKTLNFGSEPQTVSKEFYEWFTANATKQATLSGRWEWNTQINTDALLTNTNEWKENILFSTSEGGHWGRLEIIRLMQGNNIIKYIDIDELDLNIAYQNKTMSVYEWLGASLMGGTEDHSWNSMFKIINFGTEPQIVSQEFYDWFIENATPYTGTVYTLSGDWIFNDTLVWVDPNNMFITQNIEFYKSGVGYDGLCEFIEVNCDWMCDGVWLSLYALIGYENNQWQTDDKTISFGATEQEVSKEFYEWFTANATKQVIGFTVDGVEYQADSGMTWEAWINSEYNTDGFCLRYVTEETAFVTLNGSPLYEDGVLMIRSTMVIDSKINYTFTYDTGSL